MTICNGCGGMLPDMGGHMCPGRTGAVWQPYTIPPVFYPRPNPNKCKQCGSTTVDHTEKQCLMNRQFYSSAQDGKGVRDTPEQKKVRSRKATDVKDAE